jgi:hypothetical protein
MDNLHRIKRTSETLRKAASLFLWLTPLLCAIYWAFFNEYPDLMKAQLGILGQSELTVLNRALCFVATMLPAGVAMYGFSLLRELFGLYAVGEIFSERNVSCYRKLGRTLLYWAGAVFVHTTLISLAVSVGMPKGQRHLTVAFGSIELVVVFAGAAAMVISWVMDEARRIEEEQALTI